MDDADKRESGASEQPPPKIKAEDNPWYLLATLYGVPEQKNHALRDRNRIAWNRYFAANLDDETRARLIYEKRHPAEELIPFSPEELQEIAKAFADRCKGSGMQRVLPASHDNIDFSNVEFERHVFLIRYLFSGDAFFEGATFSVQADFGGATFWCWANFNNAAFSGRSGFDGAAFSVGATFSGATFSRGASFSDATFSDWAGFGSAAFSRWADFRGASFPRVAFFEAAAFSGGAYFNGATFSDEAYFRTATFGEKSSFVNAEMRDETSFEGATFEKEPPRFFGAKLHQGTVWRGIKWPPKPKDKNKAEEFIDAYGCLKLEMDRLKKGQDELDFFALELQSRSVLLGTRKGLPFAIYGALSDYGRSYLRPLVALCMVVAIGAGAFWYFDARAFWEALGLSAANTLNVFGFRKDFFEPAMIARLPAWLDVMSALQTILGAILLFLFGLGIRNKFRMK